MGANGVTSASVSPLGPRRVPAEGSGTVRAEQLAETLTEALYAGLRRAVNLWGGQTALASVLGVSESVVSERLNLRSPKGVPQRAFLDWVAVVCSDPKAAEAFLATLCDALGYMRPEKKRRRTRAELDAAIRKVAAAWPPMWRGLVAEACLKEGIDPSEFEE